MRIHLLALIAQGVVLVLWSQTASAQSASQAKTSVPSATQAEADESPPPVSLARIRAALEKPPPVLLRGPVSSVERPTFRVEVRPRFSLLSSVDEKPFDPTYGLPSAGQLLMGGIEKIRSAAVNYKRGHAKRRARQEVDDAIAAFCTVRECPAAGSR